MLLDIFVVILCVLMLGTGVFGFWMENIGLPTKRTDMNEPVQEVSGMKKVKKNRDNMN